MGINLVNYINYDPRKARVVDTVDRVESHWTCEVYARPHLDGQTRTSPLKGRSVVRWG